ncbi:MAG TPA: cbb3-type cytochrome c oxidase N-terminal domain-containing protein [Kofleriaceae bacterium]|jgi:cytochrome c oxidase cbb3-type subunit 3
MTSSIQTVTDATQIADEPAHEARLMTHSYDGIREYDNPLPGWWRMIFAGSIAFAAAYGFYFHVANWGETPDQHYKAQLADYESKRDVRARAEAANITEASLANAAADPRTVEHGAQLFQTRCVSCHADHAQGLIGPNLTDLRQIHGTTRMDLFQTIQNGAPGTAMIAWGEQIAPADLMSLAAYVSTLRGTNVPGKEPQGEPVEKFSTP